MSNTNSKNNSQSSNDDWIGEIFIAVLTGVGKLLWWGVRFPLLGVPAAAAIGAACWQGAHAGLGVVLGFVVLYTAWPLVHGDSFQRWVVDPPTHYFRRWSRYLSRWDKVCTACGLTIALGDRVLVPVLDGIRIGEYFDILDVSTVTGQAMSNWRNQAEALAAALRAGRIQITATEPGKIRITVIRGDALAGPVALPMPEPVAAVNLSAIGVGDREPGNLESADSGPQRSGRRGTRRGQGIGVVVADRRAGTRCQDRAGAVVRHRPQGRHGTGARCTDVQLLLPRRQ